MKNVSVERTMREIAALSVPSSSVGEYHSRMAQINGMARMWLQLVNGQNERHHNRRPLMEVQK